LKVITKIKNLFKSKDGKVLLENFISLSALELASKLLPLITLPYVLRVLEFDKYGIIVLANSLIVYFQAITDYSFKVTATRDVATFKQSHKKLNIIYSKVLTIKAISLILSLILITFVILIYPPFFEERLVFFLSAAMLIGYALFPQWFFQGIEKMKYITFLNIGIKVFFTIFIFIFIKTKDDYWIYPLLSSAGYIGAGIVGQYILIKRFKLKFLWLKSKTIKQTIYANFPIFINQLFPTLYNNTTSFLLGILTNTSFLGIYAAIKVIIDLVIKFLNILSRVFFPLLNRKRNNFGRYKKLMLTISLSFVLLILVSHKLIFWYLDINYNNALVILTILAMGIIGFALYDIFGLNYFIIRRQDKLVMRNTIISSLIGFLAAFPLIYYFGLIGAAINLSLSRWIMGGGLYFLYKNQKQN